MKTERQHKEEQQQPPPSHREDSVEEDKADYRDDVVERSAPQAPHEMKVKASPENRFTKLRLLFPTE